MLPRSARTLARTPRSLLAAGLAAAWLLALPGPASAHDPEMFGVAVGGDIQTDPPAQRDAELDAIREMGSRWVRLDINWAQIQAGGPESYNWGVIDPTVKAVTARGMRVLGVISYTPSWARPAGTSATHGPDPALYAAFAHEAAKHYSALGVRHYQIWNEQNVRHFWTPAPDPAHYAELLGAAYPAIKQADPGATVITGGTAPAATNGTNYSPADFVGAAYASGAGGSFDALAHHPYTYIWGALPGEPEARGWSQLSGLRQAMVANGDAGKRIWGTEFGAPTGGPGSVSEAEQAETVTRGYSLWRTYEWAGPLFAYEGRDLGTDPSDRENFFGMLRRDFSPKPSRDAYRAVASGSYEEVATGEAGGQSDPGEGVGEAAGAPPSPAEGQPTGPEQVTNRHPQLVVNRARVRIVPDAPGRSGARLIVRGSLDRRAAGERLTVRLRAAGRQIVMHPVIQANGRFEVDRRLRGPQRRVRSGRVHIRYHGNDVLEAVGQRLRAGTRAVGLRINRVRLRGDRLVVAGRVLPRARRQARIQVNFNRPNGDPGRIVTSAQVRRGGRFRAVVRVPPAVGELSPRVAIVHPGRARLFGQRRALAVAG